MTDHDHPPSRTSLMLPGQLGRRRFLGMAGATLSVPVLGPFVPLSGAPGHGSDGTPATSGTSATLVPSASGASWHQPSSWPAGRVPGARDVAVVNRRIVLAGTVTVAGLRIEPGGELVMDPDSSAAVVTSGNVTVQGQLTMRPATPTVEHRVTFIGINEARFKGGHTMQPLESDVGLWVIGEGVLDAVGAEKSSWTRATTALRKGQVEVTVAQASGWRVGDRIAIAPTGAPSLDNGKFNQDVDHAILYDEAVVASVSGTRVRLSKGLDHDHPLVEVTDRQGRRVGYGAEVMNLSRNAVIEGQPSGRAHVMFLHVQRPQHLRDLEIRHMGPRQGGGKNTHHVVGRYGLHFHMCDDATRGSMLERVVIHSAGSMAFVPHRSHGITLRECVAHDVMAGGFWWDFPDQSGKQETHDALWERCVASKVTCAVGGNEGYRMAGFTMGAGKDDSNRCLDCVAVGVTRDQSTMNTSTVSGFFWAEQSKTRWIMRGCLAHNNGGSGTFSWINDEVVHVIEGFTAYHNGRNGIDHGAYSNYWQFRDCALHGNRMAGVGVHAVSRRTKSTKASAPFLTFERVAIDGAGISTAGFTGEKHQQSAIAGVPVVLDDCSIKGARAVAVHLPEMKHREEYLVRNCHISGREFWIDQRANMESMITVENLNGDRRGFTLLRSGHQGGVRRPFWNAEEFVEGGSGSA